MQDGKHLATITPIHASETRKVMRVRSLLMHNAVFMSLQMGWMVLCVLGWMLLKLPSEAEKAGGAFCIWLAMGWLAWQFAVIFVYPEWPMNRWLCSRLREQIRLRSDRPVWATNADNGVVELVPRERWNKLLLDTAIDLMLIRIDESGIHMEGDCDRYEFPAESILGVELHSIRPSGWFTDTHMVIIYVRTEDGPMEFPISYRDHQFGCLRNSRRREQALMLVNEISSIAAGGCFGPLTDPDVPARRQQKIGERLAHADSDSELRSPSLTGSFDSASANPYRAPSIVRD